MGVGLKRTLTTSGIPVFQISKHPTLAQGGFALDITGLVADSIIAAGIPMRIDEAARTAKPVHCAQIHENAAGGTTTYKVKKNHNLIVGDIPFKTVGGAAYAITAIDTTNAAYDTFTVGTSLGALTAGDWVFDSSAAAGANTGAFHTDMKGLLYQDAVATAGESVSVIIDECIVYARRVPYSTGLEAALPRIVYSQSK